MLARRFGKKMEHDFIGRIDVRVGKEDSIGGDEISSTPRQEEAGFGCPWRSTRFGLGVGQSRGICDRFVVDDDSQLDAQSIELLGVVADRQAGIEFENPAFLRGHLGGRGLFRFLPKCVCSKRVQPIVVDPSLVQGFSGIRHPRVDAPSERRSRLSRGRNFPRNLYGLASLGQPTLHKKHASKKAGDGQSGQGEREAAAGGTIRLAFLFGLICL